jgi:hypothetical protein
MVPGYTIRAPRLFHVHGSLCRQRKVSELPSQLVLCRLLLYALRWIGEGPHVELLETILPRNGNTLVDPSKQSAFLFQNWPAACSFDWFAKEVAPDPFFIDAIALNVNHDSGEYKTPLT